MNLRLMKLATAFFPLALFAAACAAPTDTDRQDPAVSATSQAFSGYSSWIWRVNDGGTAPADLGSDTSQTCFLSGVGGNLKSLDAPGTPGNYAGSPEVNVFRQGGHYWLAVYSTDAGYSLEGQAKCIPTVQGRTAVSTWSTGHAAVNLGAATSTRRCFLTSVRNDDTYFPSVESWAHDDDYVHVWSDGSDWWLGGNGHAMGSAACVDVNTGDGTWHWIAGTTGSYTQDLAYNSGGVQCLLTGIGGRFRTNDWDDGIYTHYHGDTRQWVMTLDNAKQGWASCFE